MSLHPKLEHFEEEEDADESEDEDYVPKVDQVQKADLSVAKYGHCFQIGDYCVPHVNQEILFRREIRTRTKVYEVVEASVEVQALRPEEKQKADDLWSDFIKDVKGPEKQTQPTEQAASKSIAQTKSSGDLVG